MKCFEIEKNIDLLFDGEADKLQKQQITAHLGICDSCQGKFETLQKTRSLLRQQPVILPNSSFDNRMLQAFENKLNVNSKPKGNSFIRLFGIPKPAFALMIALFAVGLGLAFLFGRMSVSSPHQTISEIPETPQKEVKTDENIPETLPLKQVEIKTKVVTKYVEVPIVKEKIIKEKIYLNQLKTIQPKMANNNEKLLANESSKKESENNNKKSFNINDFKPVNNITYKIIKWENPNE